MADDAPTICSLEEFLAGIAGETGKPLHLQVWPRGDLRVALAASAGHEPAAGLAYRATGPDGEVRSGTTDEAGRLEHLDVPSGEYRLSVDGLDLKVPTVKRGEPHHIRWISKHPRSK